MSEPEAMPGYFLALPGTIEPSIAAALLGPQPAIVPMCSDLQLAERFGLRREVGGVL